MSTEVVQHDAHKTPAAVRQSQPLSPRVDIIEDADGITLYADIPGVHRDALHVQVEGETLTLRGDIAIALPEGMDPYDAELRSSAWERSFTLSRELDASGIAAKLKDGVLNLRIPKAEHAKPRKVDVQVS
jgi:HSP20 family molecular chaperone IbpA